MEIIENGNKPPITTVVEGVETTIAPAIAEEKSQRRLELKARSTLLMGIPNEHQLKFNSIKDAKSLLQAIEKRFGRNAATKKAQRNLLKQQYENFTTSSSEVLDQTFDRLQKLISQLEIHEEMDLRWQMAMLTIRARRFLKNTGRKFLMNGNETIMFDKTKVECYNFHKRGHFARECRAPRSQDTKHKESTRRTVPMETPATSALVSCDRLRGYDWSDQAEDGPTNFALMDYSSSSSNSEGNPQMDLQEKRVIDSKCSRHMTKNMSYLTYYKEIDEGYVAFEVPRKNNMYSVDLKSIVPKEGVTCLFGKATSDESKLWHRRLGHLNFKTMNKLVKGNLVRGIENLADHKVKVIRCDNGTEFKNREMNQFYEMKEAVNTACYVQDRVLVVKPHNKTSYELFHGRTPTLSFMRPFGCHVTILNTKDNLGKFDGKVNEGFFVGYSLNSKAFRVFNNKTRIVEENFHIRNKKDERGIMIRNKARLVPQGHTQEEGINYDEVFSPVVRIEAIRLFLAYASFKDFVVYQMDVKSAFLYGKIKEKVYVCQPPGFEDLDFPDKVYKVEKALYGLHQAPRACTRNKLWLQIPQQKPNMKLLQVVVDKKEKPRKTKRKDTQVPQLSMPTESVADEAVNEEMYDRLVRVATTASSLEAEQDSSNIAKTQSKATPNELGSQGTSSCGGPRYPETIRDVVAQTRSERVSKISNDPLLTGVNTPRSEEDRLKLTELMELCTNLQQRVLDLETTKTTQALEIDSLKKRVKKLERRKRSTTHGLKRLYKDKDIFGVNDDDDVIVEDAEMLFDVADDLRGEEVFVSQEVPLNAAATTTTATINDITLAQALTELESAKPKDATTIIAAIITAASSRPKAKGIVIHNQEQAPTPTVSLQKSSQVKDKGKGKMVEPEPVKKFSKKDQLMLDEELAFKLQAKQEEEEERIAREKS
uniref:Retrotransposon protein, putative, unclassified n=1 Tax=Tanacetum cinerariifolium TaxID=118510 RepID=A0A699GTK7_TANCI|nr:retrotransposon protein, putative, unclassified [Tanacetum cinerariifolium]